MTDKITDGQSHSNVSIEEHIRPEQLINFIFQDANSISQSTPTRSSSGEEGQQFSSAHEQNSNIFEQGIDDSIQRNNTDIELPQDPNKNQSRFESPFNSTEEIGREICLQTEIALERLCRAINYSNTTINLTPQESECLENRTEENGRAFDILSNIRQRQTVNESNVSLPNLPPTYSSIVREEEACARNDFENPQLILNRYGEVRPSPQFIYRFPPPSYAESEFMQLDMLLPSLPDTTPFWGPKPLATICPFCGTFNLTKTKRRVNRTTHTLACFMCLCLCWPCCFIPYCVPYLKSTEHYCPSCKSLLGIYQPR